VVSGGEWLGVIVACVVVVASWLYLVVRFFERIPARHAPAGTPILHYVAPRSLLVFDHLTRAIALLHAGSEDERQVLRAQVIAALRGPLPPPRGMSPVRITSTRRLSAPAPFCTIPVFMRVS
jgi:hypothetical protein